ncbi:MAG TPA: GNAT family N-acetyltransferase [Gammaproteobacteria bacterium]|nr:GNAT family N-acetyltransferase [Gammaproteobacteria bacterium]
MSERWQPRLVQRDEDIRRCHAVMRQLRPHLREAERFLARVREQMQAGYRLACLEAPDGPVIAVAGFRTSENLAWGRFLYVDDLVVDEAWRSAGHGGRMLEWLKRQAAAQGCAQLHLDSGVQRPDAHRFYQREGLMLSSYHFQIALGPPRG